MGVIDDAFCRFYWAKEETPRHLLLNCDMVSVKRGKSLIVWKIEAPLQILNIFKNLGLGD